MVWPLNGRGLCAEQTRWFEVREPTCCLAGLLEVRGGVGAGGADRLFQHR